VSSTVAVAATTAASRNAKRMTVEARTPRSCAVLASIAAARICRPMSVRARMRAVAPRRTAPTAIETSVTQRTRRSPIETARLSSPRTPTFCPRAPNARSATAWSRNDTAKVVTSIVVGVVVRSGR
jgi:hypothetical protein